RLRRAARPHSRLRARRRGRAGTLTDAVSDAPSGKPRIEPHRGVHYRESWPGVGGYAVGEASDEDSKGDEPGRHDARILVVSLEPAARLLLTQMLQRAGRAADAVATGLEAVAALARARIAVLLADADLPDLEQIVTEASIRRLPVILMGAATTIAREALVVLAK